MGDFAMPVVWPGQNITVPDDYQPYTSGVEAVSGVGHAGIVIVDGDTGFTRYYEYGRYGQNSTNPGTVRSVSIPNLEIVDGQISSTSLDNLLGSFNSQHGPIMGSVFSASDGAFENAIAFINDPNNGFNGNYSIVGRHCYTFTQEVSNAMGTSQDYFDLFMGMIPTAAMAQIHKLAGGFVYVPPELASEAWPSGLYSFDKFIGPAPNDSCFGGEVPIDMWPLDPTLKPGPDGIYDQDEVRAKVWKKPIEFIEVGDIVVSFDDNDNLVPGPVTRTFQNNAKILLDFHGTRVTPGHVYYRPDSKKSYKYETLIDVLRDDGVIKHQDGTLIRAATNVAVDSTRDGFVQAIAGKRNSDGTFEQSDEGRIRLGTRFLVGTGKERKSFAVADLIEHGGGVVGDDELIRVGDSKPVPFLWEFGDLLPKPEEFVLACSGTTLEDIYKAAEWESQGPRLTAPVVLDRGSVQPLKGAELAAMPRNEPLEVVHSPVASAKAQRTLNRKLLKTIEAKYVSTQ